MDEVESYEVQSGNVFMFFFLIFYVSVIYLWVIIYMLFFLELAPKHTMGIDFVVLD